MYQPKVVKQNDYISGVVKLRNQGDNLAVLFSSRKYSDGTFVNGDNQNKAFLASEWPEYVDPVKVNDHVVYAKLSGDGKKIFQVSPQDGLVSMRFTGFTGPEDQEPTPSTPKTDKWGNDYTTATAIFEITQGEDWMVGMPQFMTIRPSLFMPDDDGNVTIRGLGNPNAKLAPRLNEFLTNCGGWDNGPMSYVDNPLPEFQKRMLAANREVKVSLKNGFVQDFYETVVEDTDEFPSEWPTDNPEVYDEEPVVTETDSLWNDDSDF